MEIKTKKMWNNLPECFFLALISEIVLEWGKEKENVLLTNL